MHSSLRSALWLPVLVVAALCGTSFADGPAPVQQAGFAFLVTWGPILTSLVAGLQAVVIREMTVSTGFWHTNLGHAVLTGFGALLGTGMSLLQNGTFSKATIISAIAGAITAFVGAWKTDGKEAPLGSNVSTTGTPAAGGGGK